MKVPFVDLKTQYLSIKTEIDAAIQEVLDNTAFIMGPSVKKFEEGFAALHGAKYCIGTSSGTDALHLALWALGIGSGDRVIVPVNTFIATAEAVSLCGADPVFVDCDEYYNIDVQKLREYLIAISHQPSALPKAVIPVHLYGQPADISEIRALAEEYGLYVVEDACQAHCARYQMAPRLNTLEGDPSKIEKKRALQGVTPVQRGKDGEWKSVGSIGDVGTFSFYPGKNLGAYGEAGAVVTNDDKLYQKMKLIHDHGASVRYHHDVAGHNYRMAGFQGAVLSVKLKHIEKWTEKRRENAALYTELLNDVEEVIAPEIKEGRSHSFHLYIARCRRRDELKEYLEKQGIATGLHYPIPLHLQKAYGYLGYKKGDFPVAEGFADEILSLPMYPELTKAQIQYVVERINGFYVGWGSCND